MSDRTKVTHIRVSSRLEATRSPFDGQWRAHGLIPDPTADPIDNHLDRENVKPVPLRWVTLGVGKKAKDAIAQAETFLS